MQIVEEKDEHKFDFDLLDPTKIIPEELVPVRRIGKLTLNRNPDNFFAETEQVAFHPGHVVPGIDFTNDPLLQGRLFSYTDTQLIRLGGPNFHEIPINRPIAPVHNNQRDGFMRQTINKGRVAYEPNSLGGGCPFQAGADMGGFVSFAERIDAQKVRARSQSFFDHFSQATLFFNSQSAPEKAHLVKALRFELGKVEMPAIRERMVYLLSQVDRALAEQVAAGARDRGAGEDRRSAEPEHSGGRQPEGRSSRSRSPSRSAPSAALSMANTPKDSIKTRKIAALVADGFDEAALAAMKKALTAGGAQLKIVAPRLGIVTGANGEQLNADFSLLTDVVGAVRCGLRRGRRDERGDAGGRGRCAALRQRELQALQGDRGDRRRHRCPGSRRTWVTMASSIRCRRRDRRWPRMESCSSGDAQAGKAAALFVGAIAEHRHWVRETKGQVPA